MIETTLQEAFGRSGTAAEAAMPAGFSIRDLEKTPAEDAICGIFCGGSSFVGFAASTVQR